MSRPKKKDSSAAKHGISAPENDDDGLDEQCRTLLRTGLVRAHYTFTSERSLMVPAEMVLPAPWNLPSRMFRHPIEMNRGDESQPFRFGLMHPRLGDHPFVRQVEATLGITLDPQGVPNQHGYTSTRLALWWHAVDLISTGHWESLMDTREFTDTEHIVKAIGFGLHYRNRERTAKGRKDFSIPDARRMLRALGVTEPSRQTVLRDVFMAPSACAVDKKAPSWPVNHGFKADDTQHTWGTIHCLENGTFHYSTAGFLGWSERGRARFEAVSATAGQVETRDEITGTAPAIAAIPGIVEKNGQIGFDF